MPNPLATLFLLLWILLVVNCSTHTASQNIPEDAGADPTPKSSQASDCDEWQRRFDLLSSAGKEAVGRHNIAVNGEDKDSRCGYFLVAPALVSDCRTRLEMGNYLFAVIEGQSDDTHFRFAEQHSSEIVRVLRAVWDSGELSHEKDLFLVEKGIRDEDLAPFISELIERRGFDSGILYTVMTRPLEAVEPSLQRQMESARLTNKTPERIYALIALEQVSPSTKYLSELEQLEHKIKLKPTQQRELAKVIEKFKRGEKVTFADVEAVGLPMSDEH